MFNSITGKEGQIRIVELGAVIGQFSSWKLSRERRPHDDEKFTEFFTFRAECEYVNQALFSDDDYQPQIFVTVAKDRRRRQMDQFRLDQQEGRARTLTGRSLLIEGVTLCRV
jgi:hypothetical protein